jgi:protein required for attachment to host cells
MEIDHGALVMVVDGAKMLLFRNQGDGTYPDLKVEEAQQQADERDRDQKTDAAGRSMSAWGGGSQSGFGQPAGYAGGQAGRGQGGQFNPARSAMGETDYHQQAEDNFAKEAADLLKQRALANDYEKLIIVAPPSTLGELRKHYHKEVENRLAGEIAKDLVGHPVPDIEKIISQS